MKKVSVIIGQRTLSDVVAHISETYEPYTMVNELNGDQLTIEPDQPLPGLVTITSVDQNQGDDDWNE